jgi:CelD/BcsL family acetyltransferase involved in cellulose biosynthesis
MHGTATTKHATNFIVGLEAEYDFGSEEYRVLFQASGASAFQSPLWLSMMHRRLAPGFGARQKTITIRDVVDRRLLALFPFVTQDSAGITIIQPADFGVCDRNDVIGEASALEMIAGDPWALAQLKTILDDSDLLLFRKVWAGGFDVGRLFPRSRQHRCRNDAHVCETGLDPELWRRQTLRKRFTKEMGRLQRQTERDIGAYEHRAVTDADAIRQAFDFLRAARRGRYETSMLDDRRYFDFYLEFAIAGAACGEATTYVSYLAGEPVAVLFGLCGDGEFHAVLIGADIGKHERQSTGIQLLYRVMEMRIREGHASFDMGLGDPGYKAHFRPRVVEVRNVTRSYSPSGTAIAMIYRNSKPLTNFIKGIMPNVR